MAPGVAQRKAIAGLLADISGLARKASLVIPLDFTVEHECSSSELTAVNALIRGVVEKAEEVTEVLGLEIERQAME